MQHSKLWILCVCQIHLQNYSAITGNKQNNWLRTAETPPNSHSSHLQPLAYRGEVRPLGIQTAAPGAAPGSGEQTSPSWCLGWAGWDGAGSPTPGAPAALCTPHPTRGGGLRALSSCSLSTTPTMITRKETRVMPGFGKSCFKWVEVVIKIGWREIDLAPTFKAYANKLKHMRVNEPAEPQKSLNERVVSFLNHL